MASHLEAPWDWESLRFPGVRRSEIAGAVADPEWQAFRVSLIGRTQTEKFLCLKGYVESKTVKGVVPRRIQVQVTNYVNALARGGLL